MSAIVATATAEKYRNGLTVITGGRCPLRGRRRGRRTRSAAELLLDDRMHTVFVRMGASPSEGFEDIRRRRQHPWRVLARRIVEAHAAKVEHARVRAVAVELLGWIDQLYDTSGETITERIYYQSPRRCA